MSIKNNLFKEMLKMSSAAAQLRQHEGLIAQAQLLDPTQPNPPKIEKSRPNPTQSNPWISPTHGQLWFYPDRPHD